MKIVKWFSILIIALLVINFCAGCAQTSAGFDELDAFIDNPVEWVKENDKSNYGLFDVLGSCDGYLEVAEAQTQTDSLGREIITETVDPSTMYAYGLYDLAGEDYYGYYGLYVVKRTLELDDNGMLIDTTKAFVGVYDGETTYGRYYIADDGYSTVLTVGNDAVFGTGKDKPEDELRFWYYYFENVLY